MGFEERIIQSGMGARATSVLFAGEQNKAGPLVVMLHGFPDNHHTFKYQIPALVEAGYQVACPLLPGYEPRSIDPAGHYDMGAVSDYLISLISQIKSNLGLPEEDKVHLVGHDWGAISGFAVACKRPDILKSYTTITIPYGLSLKQILLQATSYIPSSWYIQLFQLRGIAEQALLAKNGKAIRLLIDHWNRSWQMPDDHKQSIVNTLSQPGVIDAAMAYYRSIYGVSSRAIAARKLFQAGINIPTLAIRGEYDNCIHESLWRLNSAKYYASTLKEVSIAAGHFPHQEKPEEVNGVMLDWLIHH